MKRFFAVLVVAAVSAWLRYYYTRPAPPPPSVASQATPTTKPKPKPAPNYVHHIVCPLCNGQRGLANGMKRDDCPLCINVHGVPMGYRNVRVSPGYELCATCQGMGLVV